MPADQYGTTESNMDHALMKSWVYPALKPEQKVMIVSGLYGDSSVTGAARDAVEAKLLDKLNGDWAWAQADPRVLGINPWHWATRPNPAKKMDLGAGDFPKLAARLKEIAETLAKNQSLSRRRQA